VRVAGYIIDREEMYRKNGKSEEDEWRLVTNNLAAASRSF
jgi:hypothetical protein